MPKDVVVTLAEEVVAKENSKYIRDLVAQFNALARERPVEAEEILGEIRVESKRQNTKFIEDEEEKLIKRLK